jgi:hypothetical protein
MPLKACIENIVNRANRGVILSLFAWQVATLLSFLGLLFSIVCHESRWWYLDGTGNCEHEFIIGIYVRQGMCFTETAADLTYSTCLRWSDKAVWKEADMISGSDTQTDARIKFPLMARFIQVMIGLSAILIIICLFSLRHPTSRKGIVRQYLFAFFAGIFMLFSYGNGHMGSTLSVTETSTWSTYHTCDQTASYPLGAYWANICALTCVGIAAFLTLWPSKFWCFHFVSALEEQGIDNTENAHAREIAMVEVTRVTSVRYADISAIIDTDHKEGDITEISPTSTVV